MIQEYCVTERWNLVSRQALWLTWFYEGLLLTILLVVVMVTLNSVVDMAPTWFINVYIAFCTEMKLVVDIVPRWFIINCLLTWFPNDLFLTVMTLNPMADMIP